MSQRKLVNQAIRQYQVTTEELSEKIAPKVAQVVKEYHGKVVEPMAEDVRNLRVAVGHLQLTVIWLKKPWWIRVWWEFVSLFREGTPMANWSAWEGKRSATKSESPSDSKSDDSR